MPHDDTIFLKTKVDILSFFNEEQLRRITPDIERKSYGAGEMIVLRGEITSGFYIVKKGKVSATHKEKDGATRKQDLPAGDFFGVISLLENQAADETIKSAEEGTEILTIPAASFQKLLEMQPLLKKAILDKVAARKKPA